MRRGLLQDYANQVCQKAAGWLMTLDEAWLVSAGTGNITVDLLSGRVSFNGVETDRALVTYAEIAPWIAAARVRDAVPADAIQAFNLSIEFLVEERLECPAQTRRVELLVVSHLTTPERQYEGSTRKRETWARPSPSTY